MESRIWEEVVVEEPNRERIMWCGVKCAFILLAVSFPSETTRYSLIGRCFLSLAPS